jgi:Leucine-rich repeat (LRR) protein
MRLTDVTISHTKVADLLPLKGMPIASLLCYHTNVSDLSPLEECTSLTSLKVKATKVIPAAVAALQKALPNCKIEWDDPAKAAATQPNKPWNTPAFQAWVKEVQAMPAEKQVEAVAKKLMELNPGFDGRVTNIHESGPPKVENGVVTELRFHSQHVTDISPLRAFSKLNALYCYPGGNAGSQLSDLSPLQGAPLTELRCSGTSVFDLSPLEGMPLRTVQCDHTHVSDLSPLLECKGIESLNIAKTKVTAASVAALQKSLPNCKIEWDGATKPKTPEPAAAGKK